MSRAGIRVVVTGLGVIAGPDVGVESVGRSLTAATMRATEVDRRSGYHAHGASQLAVLATDVDLTPWLSPATARRMSRPSRMAVAAARMALQDAGLAGAAGGARTGVVMSTAFGAVETTEQILSSLRRDGPQAASPFLFAESVANAAAGQVAIDAKAQGPNLTIVQREAGGLTAVNRATALVTTGRCDRVLVGNVDEMPPVLHALLDRFDALARPTDAHAETARPFARDRNGFIAAEGATVLVIERADLAEARGAQVRAEVLGGGSAFDPSAPRIGWGRGHSTLAAALRRTLDQSGVEPGEIGHVVSGASGSVAGDWLEAKLLTAVWPGDRLPPILTPKATLGQYGGGFLAACILTAAGGTFGATLDIGDMDPELDVMPFGGTLSGGGLSLATSCASGGSAAWFLLEGVGADRRSHSGA